MLRRTTLPGLTALTLACGAAIAATAVSATAVAACYVLCLKTGKQAIPSPNGFPRPAVP
jgi:hypothetical protein